MKYSNEDKKVLKVWLNKSPFNTNTTLSQKCREKDRVPEEAATEMLEQTMLRQCIIEIKLHFRNRIKIEDT